MNRAHPAVKTHSTRRMVNIGSLFDQTISRWMLYQMLLTVGAMFARLGAVSDHCESTRSSGPGQSSRDRALVTPVLRIPDARVHAIIPGRSVLPSLAQPLCFIRVMPELTKPKKRVLDKPPYMQSSSETVAKQPHWHTANRIAAYWR